MMHTGRVAALIRTPLHVISAGRLGTHRRWQRTVQAGQPARMTRWLRVLMLIGLALLGAGCTYSPLPLPSADDATALPSGLPNGVAAGDVSQESAVLWARAAQTGAVTFTVAASGAAASAPITHTVTDQLHPVTVTLGGLSPATTYHYTVTTAAGDAAAGRFRTPALDGHHGLRFGASGDVRGDLAPYPAIANAPGRDLDFFVMLGDSIYADFPTPAVPKQAQTLEEFLLKQAEVLTAQRGLNTLAALRASTAFFATIDDHEVLNNFAGGMSAADTPYFADNDGLVNEDRLYRGGLAAFLAYHPLRAETYGPGADAARMQGRPNLYRYQTFGADAALFVLDMRSFRDAPLPRARNTDDASTLARFEEAAFDPDRTMLGAQQLDNLQRDLLDAQARGVTWKFVVVPDPIQHLDMTAAQDRWQGYAAERSALLRFIADQAISNVVFITADIHGTVVNDLTYQDAPAAAHQPVAAWEISVGPVAAFETFGLAIILTYQELGLLSDADVEHYYSLPIRPDRDATPDDRDDYVQDALNRSLARLGYNPIGLPTPTDAASALDAELLAGDYLAAETYGWTEFEIDAATQALTVTTYGIPAYRAREMADQPDAILDQDPEIVSQFVVQPQP